MESDLKRRGWAQHKTTKRALEQCPESVGQRLEHEYQAIERRANAEEAAIHWVTAIIRCSDDVRGRRYAPQGQPLKARVPNRRFGLSIMTTVVDRGKMRWKIFGGALDDQILIDLVMSLVYEDRRLESLNLGSLRVRGSKPIQRWSQPHDGPDRGARECQATRRARAEPLCRSSSRH